MSTGANLMVAPHADPDLTAKASPWLQCNLVRQEWRRVIDMLTGEAVKGPHVPQPCRPLLSAPGKCLRAELLLLSARFGKRDAPGATSLAVAVELLHLATLFHDDVIDGAPIRRGLAAPGRQWGDAAAVYGGGYLLSRAIELFATAGHAVNELASDSITRLWMGEMEEVENMGNCALPIKRHLRIVRNKTGALFELPCSIGSEITGAPQSAALALRRFGARLGMAFQFIDDLSDLLIDAADSGKAPGMDFRGGAYTLAMLHGLRCATAESERLEAMALGEIDEASHAEVKAILERTGSIAYAKQLARTCLRSAEAAIGALPDGDASASLRGLVQSQRDLLDSLP
jgi:heptaprenyl diphosphate synthase